MRLRKLLFLTWSVSYGYGTEKSLADVLNRFDRERYEISVLPLFKYAESTIFRDHIRILDSLIDYTAEGFDEEAALKRYYELLGDPLRFNQLVREKYDCVIACNHNAPSYFASYLKGGAKVLWIRGDMSELDYRKLKEGTPEYRRVKQEYDMQANVLKCFDAIAVISDVVQQTLADLFGVTENVVKISNSVDTEKLRRLCREKVTLPDKKLFTTLGRLDYNKNQILLLKAARLVRKERDDFMIYLLGDGDDREKLETYIRENGLSDNAKILGFIENPYPYVKNSIATVLTSLSEGFSLVPYGEKELAAVLLRYLDRYDGRRPDFSVGDEYELDAFEIRRDKTFILRVMQGGVPYEYLIRRRSGNDKLIVFHNGAVPEGNVRYPVFQRHSWAELLKTSSVFCMDPTLYLNSYLQLGWGVGRNETYYLEKSSLILRKIIAKMGIRLTDTVIYGTSSGGYLSAITGIYLRGATVVADNAQLDARNWIYKDALDAIMTFCFDNISEALRYRERFSVIDAFEKHGYVPPIYLHVNLCSEADNSTQLVPFLQAAERMRQVKEYHNIKVILHFEPEKGHDGMGMEEAVAFLYHVLGLRECSA